MNKPAKAIRWTQNRAAAEFQVHRSTLSRGLIGSQIQPGEDGRYSTVQVHRAIAGDLATERIRETRAKADTLEFDLGVKGKKYIEADPLFKWCTDWNMTVVHAIRNSPMPHKDKESLLKHLRETPLVDVMKLGAENEGGK